MKEMLEAAEVKKVWRPYTGKANNILISFFLFRYKHCIVFSKVLREDEVHLWMALMSSHN